MGPRSMSRAKMCFGARAKKMERHCASDLEEMSEIKEMTEMDTTATMKRARRRRSPSYNRISDGIRTRKQRNKGRQWHSQRHSEGHVAKLYAFLLLLRFTDFISEPFRARPA